MLAVKYLKLTSKDLNVTQRYDFDRMRLNFLEPNRPEELTIQSLEESVKSKH